MNDFEKGYDAGDYFQMIILFKYFINNISNFSSLSTLLLPEIQVARLVQSNFFFQCKL